MKRVLFLILFLSFSPWLLSQTQRVSVSSGEDGQKLVVDGAPLMIKGMNWDYYPIGTNFNYSLWKQPDSFIKAALDNEMGLLQNMGVNAIRVYTGIPAKWITYIYQNYGIYTILNHSFGRYGLTLNGSWIPNTDYSTPATRKELLQEVKNLVHQYKDTPGLLMYLLGNENNYGLFWDGAETENIPVEQRKSTHRAEAMYKLFNDAALEIKSIDRNHPVAMCNGDLLFLDIIAKECQDIDILGSNVYRGVSFGDFFQQVKAKYGKPVMFTEFGADAFNALTNKEDQESQAYYLLGNWDEIFGNAAGMGNAENCIGGFTFQFSDGWWKHKQDENLEIHDTEATWSNAGYTRDFKKGQNNMNEEWFGICAKGPTDSQGFYELYPRAAYYALKDVNKFNPYTADKTSLATYFGQINLTDADLRARGDKAALKSEKNSMISISNLRADFSTYNTGGSLITTPKNKTDEYTTYPKQLGFDHMESYYIGVEGRPSENMRANVNVNILGHVAENPIDEIFYENRGRTVEVNTTDGKKELTDNNRVQIYSASYHWDHQWFNLDGFYRTGHYHWGYEGDFFNLYPEANYGANIDIYNGEAPFGFEFAGKRAISGLKVAFGPELWWGANPAFLVKYSKTYKKLNFTGIYHEDLDQRSTAESSFAIPQPKTRRLTLAIQRTLGKFTLNAGGIWAGQPLNGRDFQLYRDGGIYQDQINSKDNWGGKIKLLYTGGKFNWYAQSAAMGLVANGGADNTQTFTGWRLKDSGSGNQYNFLTGFTYALGNLQIAPNFLWQKPIEGPVPSNAPAPARPRNILEDPFVVRANREQTAGEILLTYDPTPATWMYSWDSDKTEDARLAFSVGFVYRHLPTTQDAAIGILADGRTTFAFDGAAPAKDLWEVNTRIVSKLNYNFGMIANLYGGTAQANGSDARTVKRFGAEVRTIYKKAKLITTLKTNDWGPYDYHRDYNLTYPLQLIADLSLEIGKPDWWILPGTRIGIQGAYRTLNQYSPRYAPVYSVNAAGNWVPDPTAIGYPNGNEWEIRTYIQINIGK